MNLQFGFCFYSVQVANCGLTVYHHAAISLVCFLRNVKIHQGLMKCIRISCYRLLLANLLDFSCQGTHLVGCRLHFPHEIFFFTKTFVTHRLYSTQQVFMFLDICFDRFRISLQEIKGISVSLNLEEYFYIFLANEKCNYMGHT